MVPAIPTAIAGGGGGLVGSAGIISLINVTREIVTFLPKQELKFNLIS